MGNKINFRILAISTIAILLLCGAVWARITTVVVGQGVTSSASYGVGDILSERFTADEYDNTGWSEVTQGDGSVNGNAETISGTGFVGQHLTVSGTTNFEANINRDEGAQSSVYFRFYYYLAAESWGNSVSENILTMAANGGSMSSDAFFSIIVQQNGSGQLQLRARVSGDAGWTGASTYDISTGTIYKIEGKAVDDGANGSAEWKVNGTSIGTISGLAAYGSLAIHDIWLGVTYNSVASTHHFDTLDISSTGYLTDTP